MNDKPKILHFDIETSHNILAGFSLWDPIPMDNVLIDWSILSIAWKFDGERKVYSKKCNLSKKLDLRNIDDKQLIIDFKKVYESADIIVGHYCKKFDIPKFNTRCLYYGLTPLPKKLIIDTKEVASREFAFTSNKLDFIAKYLGLKGKMTTPKNLWLDVLQGDKKALDIMVKYNEQDVVVLENVFKKLRPYMNNFPNMNLWSTHDCCTNCGSHDLIKRGYRYTTTGKYQAFECKACGKYSQSRTPLKDQRKIGIK